MLAYWQNNVAENFLPPISDKKKNEVESRKIENVPLKTKKEHVRSTSARRAHRERGPSDGSDEQQRNNMKAYVSEDNGGLHYLHPEGCMITAVPDYEHNAF